ncbi:hypothetical protein FC764_16910 [Clostridium botulinum]|nr:hypothetical protein [Clostridium botulinum]
MGYRDIDIETGQIDAETIFDALMKIVNYKTNIEYDKDFDVRKYIDIPIQVVNTLLEENFPFTSMDDFKIRFSCMIELLRVMQCEDTFGDNFKVMKSIICDNNECICFLLDERVLELLDKNNVENEVAVDEDYEYEHEYRHSSQLTDFMIDNGYDPDNDSIDDMYGLD